MFLDNPEIIVNGGLAGVCIALISVITYMVKGMMNVLQENAKAMTKMSSSLDNNTAALINNTRIMDRVEQHLNNHP